jgi:hypothetical protein
MELRTLAAAVALALLVAPAGRGQDAPGGAGTGAAVTASDPSAVAAAQAVLQRMGGRDAWNATRYVKWRFAGRRLHRWDRVTGDVRIEADSTIVLMNVRTREGRAFRSGKEITDPAERAKALEQGYAWWVNDSYWLLMPYKLLDPGVHLHDAGPSALEDGRKAHKLVVTFDSDVGLTPRNKYDVWIADDTGLVEQWAYYPDASDDKPAFILPWAGWRTFGKPPIRLATDHGRGWDWEIEVPAELPRDLFERP